MSTDSVFNDTTLEQVFIHYFNDEGSPRVYATLVEHWCNSHPSQGHADLVWYTIGVLNSYDDPLALEGEFKLWRNADSPAFPPFPESKKPGTPADVFDSDLQVDTSVALKVYKYGVATWQKKINGKPIGGLPPQPMNCKYDKGLFVERGPNFVRSLSFTLADYAE